ncbi:hypothetical protein MMC22_003005 [Lobaria immixta]|nr:hypothetical protein [Lobaria immixta]
MPCTFLIPTTSNVSFSPFFHSSTHPSLPLAATTQRAVLRNVLKKHKRLPAQSQWSNLGSILSALEEYIPYLFALDAGLGGNQVNGEEIDITLLKEIDLEWRTSLAARIPGREPPRLKGKGLDYEICFVLSTLAYVSTLLAQSQLRALYASVTPTAEQRTGVIAKATRYLLEANSIHAYLVTRAEDTAVSSSAIETTSAAQGALAQLVLAEATLLAVLKDDPYPAIVAQGRNKSDDEWKFKAPDIPKVRAHLFARLCLAAAEHAAKAEAMLNVSTSGKMIRVDDGLVKYINDLRRTSKAKAYRLFGIDAELGGETAQGIAWLMGGKKELGFPDMHEGGSKMKGLAKFKKEWTERREDKKIEKGGQWGGDGGRFEEARIIEMLDKKWNKMNDTMNTQIIPSCDTMLAKAPSGRDIHSTKLFVPPVLDEDTLARMRGPPDVDEGAEPVNNSDSSDEEDHGGKSDVPGSFPGRGIGTSGEESYY